MNARSIPEGAIADAIAFAFDQYAHGVRGGPSEIEDDAEFAAIIAERLTGGDHTLAVVHHWSGSVLICTGCESNEIEALDDEYRPEGPVRITIEYLARRTAEHRLALLAGASVHVRGHRCLADAPELSDEDWGSVDRKLADEIESARGTPEYEHYSDAIERRQATLAQVRKAQRLTQQQLAVQLGLSQAQVSRIEGTDVNIMLSTLAKFVEATGGKLNVTATYPDGDPVELLIRDEAEDLEREVKDA